MPSLGIKKSFLRISGMCLSIRKAKLIKETTRSKAANSMFDKDINNRINKLKNGLNIYFTIVERLFKDNWKLGSRGFVLDDGGNSVMIYLFEVIISAISLKPGISRVPTEAEYELYLTPIKDLFDKRYNSPALLGKLRRSITSEAAKDDLLSDFIIKIQGDTGDKQFGANRVKFQLKEFGELEKNFRELLNKVLNLEKDDSILKESLSKSDYGKITKRIEKEGKKKKVYQELTLGQCKHIIFLDIYSNKFESIFINDEGFDNKHQFRAAMEHICKWRHDEYHKKELEKKFGDEQLLILNIERFNKCLDIYLNSPAE